MKESSVVTVEWSPASDPFDDTPTWVDITASVRSVSIERGRGGVFELYAAGRASIVLSNRTGTFDPTAWHRWRQVRITATATGPTSNVLFRGFVETIRHDQSQAPKDAVAVIEATDLMGLVARYEYVAASVPEEMTGARIGRVLTAIGVPAAWKAIDTGYMDIVALNDGVYNALAHIQDVVESEAGGFYAAADGTLTFEDRYTLVYNLTTPLTVFSNTAAGAEVRYLFGDVVLSPPGTEYRNSVTFTGASGTPQTASDVPANYPPDSLSRTVLMRSDVQALSNAQLLLEVYSQTGVIWPERLTVSVWPNAQNTLDEITALDLRDYCQVEFTPMGKTQQTYKVFVESISHTIGGGHWSAQIGFSSADRWEDAWGTGTDYLILNDATYGKLNTGKLGF